ncbi:MAG TPA: hypothetical protein VMZ53_02245 [Kofleriaceae bacterium]|nr:hypothetical protein [Kofleriaceae bacterium]
MKFPVLGAALAVALLTFPASSNARSLTDVVLDPQPGDPQPESAPVVDLPLELPAPAPLPVPADKRLDELVKAGREWRIETTRGPIHVWIPASYDAATAATVVFVHGYHVDIDHAWDDYHLPQQFALSGINAMFIAPEAPLGKRDAISWPSLRALVASVATHLDGVHMPTKRLVAMGHSGAYRTLAVWLANEGLDTVVLLDAVYGEYSFAKWLRESKTRRLINIAYETGRYSDYMHRMLPSTTKVDGLPLGGFPDARITYAKTDVGHWQLVTDGVAIPLSLRAIKVPMLDDAPMDIPLGLPQRCKPAATQETVAASDPPVPVLPPE